MTVAVSYLPTQGMHVTRAWRETLENIMQQWGGVTPIDMPLPSDLSYDRLYRGGWKAEDAARLAFEMNGFIELTENVWI